jgi:16S rRNA (guanine966-N2)-methyltransferase
MLGDLDEVDVLDAFAGTGAFGLEMLSRGVGSCTFFENDRRALGVLRSNIELCGIDRGRFQVVSRDVFKAFSGADSPRAYRLVFLDPPYACTPQDVFTLLDNMRRCGALVGDSLILYEHALTASEEVRASAGSFAIEDIRRFGKTAVAVIHGGEM